MNKKIIIQICRNSEFSHYNRICALQHNRVAYYRHGCSCPLVHWHASVLPYVVASWFLSGWTKNCSSSGWHSGKKHHHAPGFQPWSCQLLALNNHLSAGASVASTFSFFCFPCHFVDTSILTFRLH